MSAWNFGTDLSAARIAIGSAGNECHPVKEGRLVPDHRLCPIACVFTPRGVLTACVNIPLITGSPLAARWCDHAAARRHAVTGEGRNTVATATATPGGPERRARKATKETRQQQLIEATIDSLAKRGYSDTTLADVADGAGLSRGIVNFHFESKEKLLVATLQYMADEYAANWNALLEKAGPRASDRLWALVGADFDRKICTKRKIAAWCAFWGEAKSRPTYQSLCGASDVYYIDTFISICSELQSEGGYTSDAKAMALGLCAMIEGLWLRLMMADGLTREHALMTVREFVATIFPKHFSADSPF